MARIMENILKMEEDTQKDRYLTFHWAKRAMV